MQSPSHLHCLSLCAHLSYVDQTFAEAEPTDSPAGYEGLADADRQQQRFENFTFVMRAGQSEAEESASASGDAMEATDDAEGS